MSKYDFPIDLAENTSTGILLRKIPAGSSVLEFGCAEGRMTRYMKKTLNCNVTIVECDADAFACAMQYADDGLCADIMCFTWAERFSEKQFDIILFADVLEHLTAPEEAFARAARLLKNSGKILISVPNITHNDILLKAVADHFDYTEIGLLDNTHIHFWGLENFSELAERSGLHIQRIEATYCHTGETEQGSRNENAEMLLLENILKGRTCGEIYQFIVTFGKNDEGETIRSLQAPAIFSHLYLDTGNGFNPEQCLCIPAEKLEHDVFLAHCVFRDVKDLKRIRMDPVEGQNCILRRVSFYQGGKRLPMSFKKAIQFHDFVLMLDVDSGVTVELLNQTETIQIDVEIVLPGNTYIAMLEQEIQGLTENRVILQNGIAQAVEERQKLLEVHQKEIQKLVSRQRELLEEKNSLEATVAERNCEIGVLKSRCAELEGNCDSLEKQCHDLTDEHQELERRLLELAGIRRTLEGAVSKAETDQQQLRTELGAYAILAYRKDQYLLQLEAELKRLQGFRSVRFHNFCGRVYRKLRHLAGTVFRRLGLRR